MEEKTCTLSRIYHYVDTNQSQWLSLTVVPLGIVSMAQQLRKQHSSTRHSCAMFACMYMPYLQAVKNNDVEAVQLLLDSLSPHTGDMAAVQEEVMQYTSDKGWNVFHYAAYYHSVEIMEQLVTFLKGNITMIIVTLVFMCSTC